MADTTALKNRIRAAIKANDNQEITGPVLQQALLDMVDELNGATETEADARQSGDTTLQQNINAEAQTRSQADTTLQQNINAEAQTRSQADTTLQQNIDAEAQTRSQADTQLNNLVTGIKNNIDNGYVYAGIATPSSTPVSGKVFYIATAAGTYTNFGGQVLTQGINILRFNGSAWSSQQLIGIDDVPTAESNNLVKSRGAYEEVSRLGQTISEISKVASTGPREEIIIQTKDDTEILKITPDSAFLFGEPIMAGKFPMSTEEVSGKEKITIATDSGTNIVEIEKSGVNVNALSINGDQVVIKDLPTSKELSNKPEKIEIKANDDTEILKIEKDGLRVNGLFHLDGTPFITEDNNKYNNVTYNSAVIASFMQKYLNKEVDEFNQLSVHICGDSIFGRVDKGSSWNPSSPEMSLTPDCNDPEETQPGYLTGHFPPNMWEQNVPFKLLQFLQYIDSKAKYFNHSAAEVEKTGSWIDDFPLGADSLRVVRSITANDIIELTFSNATFAKIVLTGYTANIAGAEIEVQISENGGEYKTPSELNIVENYAHTTSGVYLLGNDIGKLKFGELRFGGFDITKTYKLRLKHTNTSLLRIWGFETWVNPTINVVDCAEGGNVAGSQIGNPQRFWNENTKPELTIYELPYLNDLGTGIVLSSKYGGVINKTSTPILSPVDGYTYYCSETGVYPNFNNLYAYKDTYISYNSTTGLWVNGSQYIENIMANYKNDVKISLQNIKRIGIPIIAIITHDGWGYAERPFSPNWGANILRYATKQLSYATIDLNAYQHDFNLFNIFSDGTHLNDAGVQMYSDLIKEVINFKNSTGSANWDNNVFYGHSTTDNVSFNVICSKIPTVQLLNSSRQITTITRDGFTTTGTGEFDYMVIVNK